MILAENVAESYNCLTIRETFQAEVHVFVANSNAVGIISVFSQYYRDIYFSCSSNSAVDCVDILS